MGKSYSSSDSNPISSLVPDLVKYGDTDSFELICKASSQTEQWMKSTTALEIPGLGCIVKVSEQQGDNLAVSTVWVPNCKLCRITNPETGEVARALSPMYASAG